MIAADTIQAIADRIAERCRPERIVLFGSYARGEAGEGSDVDLLVEFETDPRAGVTGNPVRRALGDEFLVPMDLVIRTSAQVRQYRDNPYSVIHNALAEGRVLYEKRAG